MAPKVKFARNETARIRGFLMNFLYPICRKFGTMFGMDGERIDDYFIEKNNRVIARTQRRYRSDEVLLVLPHCLQDWECPHRITADIRNCQGCGNCCIPQLVEIADRYKVAMRVVGGGQAARLAVYDTIPSFVVAVACEHDMISGIRDAIPLPLWGILNERPNGPCRNTRVDIKRVEDVLEGLVDNR